MENLDPNQLPMLPDPTEGSASPTPVARPAMPLPTAAPQAVWFRTKQGKLILGATAAIAVVLVVLFSQQLGQLLNLFGTKAGTNQSVMLDNSTFFAPGFVSQPADSFQLVEGKLMLSPTNNLGGQ